jgi:hypothetical protein
MNSKMISEKKVPFKKLSLIAHREIKSVRNTPEKSKSYGGRYYQIILKRNLPKYYRLDFKNNHKGNYLNKNCVQI